MANPITVAEAVAHLRLGALDASETAELNLMIETATEYASAYCNRPFTASAATMMYTKFPFGSEISMVSYGDIQSITSITYYDTANVQQTFADYRVINRSGVSMIYPAFGEEWPSDCNELPYNITVSYVSGNEAAVPAAVKSAILLMVGDLYENREGSVTGMGITHLKVSLTAERLLAPFKNRIA